MKRTAIAVAGIACAMLTQAALARAAGAPDPAVSAMQRELQELKTTVRDLTTTLKSQNATIEKQSQTIDELEKRTRIQPLVSAPYPGPGGPPVPASSLPPVPPQQLGTATPALGMAALNPEVGVVGDVVGNATTNNGQEGK